MSDQSLSPEHASSSQPQGLGLDTPTPTVKSPDMATLPSPPAPAVTTLDLKVYHTNM